MNAGVMLVLAFVGASAARDVFFGGVFQEYRFFDVILLSFALTTALFGLVVALAMPGQIARLGRVWREAVLANLGTAAAWLSFFYALKLLEPSVVNTIHAGAGPITLIALNALGLHLSGRAGVGRGEILFQGGVVAALTGLAAVVLADLSGLPRGVVGQNVLGLCLAVLSGAFIAVTTDVTRRMHARGVSAEGVLAVRFWGMVAVAGAASWLGVGAGRPLADAQAALTVAAAALVLIVLPLYLLQLGIVRISALSAWVLLALGPCLVFAAQLFDGRIATSPWTLGCIALYTVSAIGASLVRSYER